MQIPAKIIPIKPGKRAFSNNFAKINESTVNIDKLNIIF
jgi:hypothetical protein